MKIVLLGAPGSGKGTQAKQLGERHSLAHISTGDMLRQAVRDETELGKQVKSIIDAGRLVPDELIVGIIKERVQEEDCAKGYILDGFPRTKAQAEALENMLKEQNESLTHVLLLQVDSEEVLRRLTKRRDKEGRADDSESTQRDRLEVYERETKPVIDYYQG